MNDLRKAAETVCEVWFRQGGINYVDFKPYMEALRQALAQPEQEQYVTKVVAMHEDGTYTTERIPLPKREWVGITKEDKKEILEMTQPDERGYVIAITEAKLKEKNT